MIKDNAFGTVFAVFMVLNIFKSGRILSKRDEVIKLIPISGGRFGRASGKKNDNP
jgi:hypothetical protein